MMLLAALVLDVSVCLTAWSVVRFKHVRKVLAVPLVRSEQHLPPFKELIPISVGSALRWNKAEAFRRKMEVIVLDAQGLQLFDKEVPARLIQPNL